MLVITRKNGQKIIINDNIEITIVDARNGSARIAIQADKDVKIYREEIYLQIKLANLMGKSAQVNSVNSVSDMLKDKETINDNNIENSTVSEEVVVDEKKSKTIRIYKKNDGQN